MNRSTLLIALTLVATSFSGCIAGDSSSDGTPDRGLLGEPGEAFTVRDFIQRLETDTDGGLVSARVESLQIEYNQSRVTLVEWRSFTETDDGCDLVSTMAYEGQGSSGGFLVHKTDEPCPLTLNHWPTVAEVVALVDRAPPTRIQTDIVDNAPIFSVSLVGYCAHTDEGPQNIHKWNGDGFTESTGAVRCGGGSGSALTLAVTVPTGSGDRSSPSSYVILEPVAAQ